MLWRLEANVRGFAQSPSTLFFEAESLNLTGSSRIRLVCLGSLTRGAFLSLVSTDVVGGICVGSADPACMADVLSHLPVPPPIF